jgi:hypothetical protein
MRTPLFYDTVKIDGAKKKILEFNETEKFMDEKELKHFEVLCTAIESKDKYHMTKIVDYGSVLMAKLINLRTEIVFPCLDMYRIFLCHPDMTCHFKKYEDGKSRIWTMVNHLNDKNATDPTIMLALRCLCNFFNDQSGVFGLREMRQRVMEAVAGHLGNAKNTIKESAITVFLNYSVVYLMKDDPEGRI